MLFQCRDTSNENQQETFFTLALFRPLLTLWFEKKRAMYNLLFATSQWFPNSRKVFLHEKYFSRHFTIKNKNHPFCACAKLCTCTCTCAYQGVRNVGFPENFADVLNG